ncbi:MAG: hypothetical protein AAGF15_00190 [Pseudomonadota bacterium]
MTDAATFDDRPTPRVEWPAVLLFFFAAIVAHVPHLVFARVDSNLDFLVHYRWSMEMVEAWGVGDFYPRWMAYANGGLGEPALLFYSPLYYWATALVRQIVSNTFTAMQIVEIFASFWLGLFVAKTVSIWATPRLGRIAGLSAIIAPMTLLLHHGFNGFPWAVAMAPAAMLIYAVMRPKAPSLWVNPLATISIALLVITHTVTALLALMVVSFHVFGAVSRSQMDRPNRLTIGPLAINPRPWVAWLCAVVLGLGLSGFYLIPAMGSLDMISAGVWTNKYVPWDAFAFSTFSWAANGMRWFAFQWPIPVALLLLVVGAAIALSRSKPADRGAGDHAFSPAIALIAMALAALFFASELSYPLWLFDTPLRKVQFPFRFMTLLTPIALILAAYAWVRLAPKREHLGLVIVALPIALHAAMGIAILSKNALMDGTPLASREDQLIPYKGLGEYLPPESGWRDYRDSGGWQGECARQRLSCSPRRRIKSGWELAFTSPTQQPIILPFFAFPALEVAMNGETVPLTKDRQSGLIRLEAPQGAQSVSISWAGVALERLAPWISLFSFFLLLLAMISIRMVISPKKPVETGGQGGMIDNVRKTV